MVDQTSEIRQYLTLVLRDLEVVGQLRELFDSNSSPVGIDYLVPGNDDAIRSISLFTRAVSDACIEGSKLATGLKPSSDESGPKIIKKEEKQKALDEKNPVEETQESKAPEKIQESKQGEEKAEASDEDQKAEDSKEAKEN